MSHHLRIARPVSDLARTTTMYCHGLGLRIVGSFEDHDGFDGVMLGLKGSGYHFEFTHSRTHPVVPAPTPEDLLVFYVPTVSNRFRPSIRTGKREAEHTKTQMATASSCSKRSGAMSRSLEPTRPNNPRNVENSGAR